MVLKVHHHVVGYAEGAKNGDTAHGDVEDEATTEKREERDMLVVYVWYGDNKMRWGGGGGGGMSEV